MTYKQLAYREMTSEKRHFYVAFVFGEVAE